MSEPATVDAVTYRTEIDRLCARVAELEQQLGTALNDRDREVGNVADLEQQLLAVTSERNAYRDALTVMRRERDDARAVTAEILPEYERVTRFDRTQADEDRLAGWRKRVELEPGQ